MTSDNIFTDLTSHTYDPPYDSPIEDIFAYTLLKYLDSATVLEKQVEVPTPVGHYRLDFVLKCDALSIGLECDGEDYHDAFLDEWRDAMILGTNIVKDIIRFPGKAIHSRLSICLYRLADTYPIFFSKRGLANIQLLARAEAEAIDDAYGHPLGAIDFSNDTGKDTMLKMIRVEIRSQYIESLMAYRKYAIDSGLSSIEAVVTKFKQAQQWGAEYPSQSAGSSDP